MYLTSTLAQFTTGKSLISRMPGAIYALSGGGGAGRGGVGWGIQAGSNPAKKSELSSTYYLLF